jgi:RNA polymerase sigma factor (sigma-70 family)
VETAAISDEVVGAAASGDDKAQTCVLHVFASQVRIMVNARLNPTTAQTQLAEDIVQESLLALRESLATLERRTVAGLRAFASTIVSRRVTDALRDKQRMERRGPVRSLDSHVRADLSAATPLWALLSASGASPLTQIDQASLQHRVLSELTNLKPEHREVITLAFFDQLETRDIAERMSISRPAASMLLIRAVKTLRRNLTGTSQIIAAHHDQG